MTQEAIAEEEYVGRHRLSAEADCGHADGMAWEWVGEDAAGVDQWRCRKCKVEGGV